MADLPDEEWRDVPGFEGLYAVSTAGRVRSLERRCAVHGGRGTRLVRERVLKNVMSGGSARVPTVGLHDDGVAVRVTVTALMLTAFVRGPKAGEVAYFKDGDPGNVALDNLEWSTRKDIAEARLNGGYSFGKALAKRWGHG